LQRLLTRIEEGNWMDYLKDVRYISDGTVSIDVDCILPVVRNLSIIKCTIDVFNIEFVQSI